jgi:hypothetical protein
LKPESAVMVLAKSFGQNDEERTRMILPNHFALRLRLIRVHGFV